MSSPTDLYPSLGRYFDNMTQLAHAANRSRTYVTECRYGKRNFTRADKKAIAANIAMRIMDITNKSPLDYSELTLAHKAWGSAARFDEIYKVKETS